MTKASTVRDVVTSHECGFVSKPTTAGAAAYALRKHSCERYRRIAESKRRGDAQRAAVDRTPKPCLHKVAQHEHGTRACYVLDRCRCWPCANVNAATERRRIRDTAYGRWQPYVDAEPARQHVRALMDAGVGLKRIAKVSGIGHGTLWKLMYGKRRANGVQKPTARVRWETAVRLMVVPLPENTVAATLAPGAVVEPTGTYRRLQALVAIGWSQSKLARQLGFTPANFTAIVHGRRRVTTKTARRVVELYNALWSTAPAEKHHRDKIAASRSRNYAAHLGWLPPMAWDEDSIDDVTAVPNATGYDEDRVLAVLAGALVDGDEDLVLELTRADRLEVFRRGRAAGMTKREVAAATGISVTTFHSDQSALNFRPSTSQHARKLPAAEDLEFLLENGESITAIALRFGVSEDGVSQALRRHPAA
ncbi:helix-turn-helix transcriptional regulator [Jatrophihabitans sp.]|uniref:helix-turn-helix transcriptional regulator n=1 Tax=Jatrophihabitans sp. TaxID=1932789 RepID=UPI0030C6C13A|nr:hypothetical protein [Jatrophihabitans sp.]